MATNGGTITLSKVDMNTNGANSGAIATDRGSGTITITGGMVTTTGQDSPAIYSTGTITVSDAALTTSGAEAAVIKGANSNGHTVFYNVSACSALNRQTYSLNGGGSLRAYRAGRDQHKVGS